MQVSKQVQASTTYGSVKIVAASSLLSRVSDELLLLSRMVAVSFMLVDAHHAW